MMTGDKHSSVVGLGIDIVEIERIRLAIQEQGDRFLNRLFTDREIAYCQQYRDAAARFAGRFSAKEAIVKALGTGIGPEISWKEIEILNDARGKPEAFLSDALMDEIDPYLIELSISHCHAYATAVAVRYPAPKVSLFSSLIQAIKRIRCLNRFSK